MNALMARFSSSPVAINAGWLALDRVFRLVVAFAVNLWIARSLGPTDFGVFSYVQATISLVAFLGLASIEAIIVRMLVEEPDRQGEILGSALVMRALGGILVVSIVVAFTLTRGDTTIAATIAPIMAGATIFQSFDVVDYWCRTRLLSRHATLARIGSLSLGAVLRIAALQAGNPLLALAIAILAESAITAVALFVALRVARASDLRFSPRLHRMKGISLDSLPLLLSAFCVAVYVRFGYLAIESTRGMRDLGIFSAAMVVTETLHIPGVAIAASVGPALLRDRLRDNAAFEASLVRLIRLAFLGSVAVALVSTIAAPFLLPLLLGATYEESGALVALLGWSIVFVYLSAISEYWLIAHKAQAYFLPKTAISAGFFLLFVFPAAKELGANGVAILTIATFSISALWSNLLFRRTRQLFFHQIRAIATFR